MASAMTAVNEGQPFSATWNKVRGKAGGMTCGKADTEFKDNSFDAGATYANTKVLSILSGEHKGNYIVEFDDGKGSTCLPHNYGLGETMARKADNNMSGLYLHGHTAAVGFHNPEFAYSESVCNGSFSSLMFKSGAFSKEIDENSTNLRSANVQRYMKCNEERLPSQTGLLNACIEGIKSTAMKKQLEDIRDGVTPSYMLNILKLQDSAIIPDGIYSAFIMNERMYYYEMLKNQGRTITLETSDGKIHEANATNAIDPLWDRLKFKPLESTLTIKRSPIGDKKLVAKLELKNQGDDTTTQTLFISHSSDGRRKMPVVLESAPIDWREESPTLITLHGSTNALSKTAAESQKNMLNSGALKQTRLKKGDSGEGSEFPSIDDLRGVFFAVHRILGKPYWKKSGQTDYGFGAERNSGQLRCFVKAAGEKKIIAEMLGLQSNKHNTDFSSCDNIIHRYLYCIVGIIVHKYTSCTINGSSNPITENGWQKHWPLKDIVDHIMERPPTSLLAVARAPAVPARAPPLAPTPAAPTATPTLARAPTLAPAPAPARSTNTVVDALVVVDVPVVPAVVPLIPAQVPLAQQEEAIRAPIDVRPHRRGLVTGAELSTQLRRVLEKTNSDAEYTDETLIKLFNILVSIE